MADYYSQCVVQPYIADRLVDKADRLALEGLGYTFEADGAEWYLFAAEGENSTACGMNPNDWIEVIDAVYPPGVERPAWMERLGDYLSSSIEHTPSLRTMIASDCDLDLTAVPLSAAEIFQAMLQKPVNTGERAIKEITIEGSWTCSTARPDGFGGWVERITTKGIRYDSTTEILERWANEAEEGSEDNLLEAAKAVLANWEHGDLAAAVRQLAAAVDEAEAE